MLLRFSLYGLLNNQRYFEAFLFLALLERGLSFTQLGLLIAVRELSLNLFEVPSGVMADLVGRRRVVLSSTCSYVIAYALLADEERMGVLAIAMALVGFGDAFRSGTHKAIIFDWLTARGREHERVKIYGFTRSWSQIGSAIAVPVGVIAVLSSGGYALAFWLSIVPAALNVINVAGYPRSLEGPRQPDASLIEDARALLAVTRKALGRRPLRRLLGEATAMGGLNRATKDYLQPLLEHAALALPWLVAHPEGTRAALLVGAVYSGLFVLSATASRHAHRLVERLGDLERASRVLWSVVGGTYVCMLVGLVSSWEGLAILAFVALALLHNLFRPVLIGRFDEHTPAAVQATVLSVESQAVSLGAALLAPAFGLAIDLVRSHQGGTTLGLWPIAVVGSVVSMVVLVTGRRRQPPSP